MSNQPLPEWLKKWRYEREQLPENTPLQTAEL